MGKRRSVLPPSVSKSSDAAPARADAGAGKPASEAQNERDRIETPARITAMHAQDRELSVAAGAPKGFRRIDRLQWLADHGTIADHQLFAGRRLQQDWQLARIETGARMMVGTGGGAPGLLSDTRLDAGRRVQRALAVLPGELRQLTELFLLPEDHPFSLERVAAIVREDRRAAAFGIRIALSLLAKHYGY